MYGDARKEKMHEEKEMPWRQISVCGPKACLKGQQEAKKRKEVRQDQTTAPWHQSSVCGPN